MENRLNCYLTTVNAALGTRLSNLRKSRSVLVKTGKVFSMLAEMKVKTRKSLHERILDAEERCGRYLADANEAHERGEREKAEKLWEKSGFWRDRYNKLTGNA